MVTMSERRRIVVTGAGWITPLGFDLDTVWNRLINGESGVSRIDRFDAGTFPTTFAAQIRNYDFTTYVENPKEHQHAGLHTQFALGAARQAWEQACLSSHDTLDRRRIGIYLGAGEGVLDFTPYSRVNVSSWDEERQASRRCQVGERCQ
jgi:3-oxoacyl-[acyl-carrier-protein] synthase II